MDTAIAFPVRLLNRGEWLTPESGLNAAGKAPPTAAPSGASPQLRPILNKKTPVSATTSAMDTGTRTGRSKIVAADVESSPQSPRTTYRRTCIQRTRGTMACSPEMTSTAGVFICQGTLGRTGCTGSVLLLSGDPEFKEGTKCSAIVSPYCSKKLTYPVGFGTGDVRGTFSGGGTYVGRRRPSKRIVFTGIREASVTTPNPVRGDGTSPLTVATPTPRAMISGTVTGPVVTALRSQARPMRSRRPLKKCTYAERANVIEVVTKAESLCVHALRIRRIPSADAIPTPQETARNRYP
mmetsp:Transcript_42129/g.112698  ORF Transcript_42129/g.112698 Transcript_42129/m.112698 type:complete len:295 (-) Transcript_42129:753-1637(-)